MEQKIHARSRLTQNAAPPGIELIKTIATTKSLEWLFSDGRTVSYPRDPIDIGNLEFSYSEIAKGKFVYRYTFDNRNVEWISCTTTLAQRPLRGLTAG